MKASRVTAILEAIKITGYNLQARDENGINCALSTSEAAEFVEHVRDLEARVMKLACALADKL